MRVVPCVATITSSVHAYNKSVNALARPLSMVKIQGLRSAAPLNPTLLWLPATSPVPRRWLWWVELWSENLHRLQQTSNFLGNWRFLAVPVNFETTGSLVKQSSLDSRGHWFRWHNPAPCMALQPAAELERPETVWCLAAMRIQIHPTQESI